METIILSERIVGRKVYPMGMSWMIGSKKPEQIQASGNTKRLPPVGMCGKLPEGASGDFPLLATTPYDTPQKATGRLSSYLSPVIPVRFMKGSQKSEWFDAMIDTGSFYSLGKAYIFKSLEIESIGHVLGDHIEDGATPFETYPCCFQISDLKVAFSTVFMKLSDTFQYDAILGSHIFEISNLHVYGKEKRFELIFV